MFIDTMLFNTGKVLELDKIIIRELVEDGKTLKCTFEWDKNGEQTLLGSQSPYEHSAADNSFVSSKTSKATLKVYNENNREPGITTEVPGRHIKAAFQISLTRNGILFGYVDFIDLNRKRIWNESDFNIAHSCCNIFANYFNYLHDKREVVNDTGIVSNIDKVTNLPDYDSFVDIVNKSIDGNVHMKMLVGCADLINFKYINDKYGYESGNEILRQFARAVYGFFDRTISCCREYSDHFLVAVKISSEADEIIAKSRLEDFALYFRNRCRTLIADSNIIVNMGACILEPNDNDLDSAIANANLSRKHARNVSSDICKVEVFSSEMLERRNTEIQLIANLDSAIEKEEFKVFLQPKVSCATGRIVGAEALVRWIKDDGKMIYPDSFIPAFERDGCIVKVDYFVYDKVFKYIRERIDAGLECVKISMNVSRVHLFNKNFVEYISGLLNKYQIPSQYIEFEITESIYSDELPTLKYTSEYLKKNNISVSIDDFGTGYSSLDIITEIPISVLKLDKVFMKKEHKIGDKIIIGTIIDMCKRMNIKVLCEGVEYMEQYEFLCDSLCDEIQGYLFSKPVDIASFNDMVDTGKKM